MTENAIGKLGDQYGYVTNQEFGVTHSPEVSSLNLETSQNFKQGNDSTRIVCREENTRKEYTGTNLQSRPQSSTMEIKVVLKLPPLLRELLAIVSYWKER